MVIPRRQASASERGQRVGSSVALPLRTVCHSSSWLTPPVHAVIPSKIATRRQTRTIGHNTLITSMSDTEQQAKATTPEDVVMEEEDAPAAKDEDVVPATDEEPAAAEPESKETEKPAAKEKPASSKSKSKAGQSSRKDSGTSARKIGGKFAKADAKASNKGKYNFGDICLGRVKGFPFWRE